MILHLRHIPLEGEYTARVCHHFTVKQITEWGIRHYVSKKVIRVYQYSIQSILSSRHFFAFIVVENIGNVYFSATLG